MGRRSRTRGHRRAGRRPAGSRRRRGRARGSTTRRRRRRRGRPASACSPASRRTSELRLEARVVGQVEDVARRLVGECQGRDPHRLGHPDREVGDDRAGRRIERVADLGHARPRAPRSGPRSPREPAPNVGRRATVKSSEPNTPRSAPSQATGRVQPCRRPDPGDRRRRARAGRDTTSSTWAGPAAWRKVPHVVATGKTRLVTRNVAKATMTTGRIADPRTAHGRPTRPMTEIGTPGSSSTLNRLWLSPSTRISTQPRRPDGEVARQGRRVVPGEDVEARDRERVGHGLAGQRAAERDPVADRPRAGRPARPRRRPRR